MHDVGSENGAPFLVTELLEGESLRQRLSRGRLPLRSALDLGVQIAEGLAAAHARGVVHRDVKPENVFLTSGGRAKLLDFGIAKLTAPRPIEGTRNLLDTTLTPEGLGTLPGAILGTPGYMSPEQVRGDPVDARTDIFSLGVVLYEMLAGAPAFPGRSLIESGHAILESDPPSLPESVPPSVEVVVRRCLEKEAARRFQSAADLAFALGAATTPTSGKARAMGSRTSPSWVARLVRLGAVLALVAVMALTARWTFRPPDGAELPTFEPITFRDAAVGGARFTPGGRVVFSASFQTGPEEVFEYAPGSPGFQPLGLRSARLAAVSSKTGELGLLMGPSTFYLLSDQMVGTLARVPAMGGVPREVSEQVASADWTGSGELAVARKGPSGMWIERPLGTKVWEGTGAISSLRFSPDGERLAFFHHPHNSRSEIIVLDRSNTAHVVVPSAPDEGTPWSLSWTPDGKRLRIPSQDRTGTLLSSVSLQGDVRPLYRFPEVRLLQDIAPDGTMLFSIWNSVRHHALIRPGQPSRGELAELGRWTGMNDLSRDGQALLLTDEAAWGSEANALLGRTDGTPPKLVGPGYALALSPDGRTVAMKSTDRHRVLLVPTGAGATEAVLLSGMVVGTGSWSRDGRRLWISARENDQARFRLFPVDMGTRKLLEPIAGSDLFPGQPIATSSDDRWIAAAGADRVLTVYPVTKGDPIRISSVEAEFRPFPAGWTSAGELWVVLPLASPPRLVRLEVPSGKITRSIDIDLRQLGGDELSGARITPDESLVAIEYVSWRARLELVKGIPPGR